MSDQWAKVPLDLLTAVSLPAVALYACIAAHAHRTEGTCRLSNATLVERSGLSLASVKRAKSELVAGGWIEHDGAQGRANVPTYRLTESRFPPVKGLTDARERGSGMHHRTEVGGTEVETPSLRDGADTALFDVEPVTRETPVGHACLVAFFDAYGKAPFDVRSRAALGRAFREAGKTYPRAELLAVAAEMGRKRNTNPRSVVTWLLRARQPEQRSRDGWSRIAAATLPDPFAQQA